MLPVLLVAPAAAATVAVTLSASFTVTKTEVGVRPGFGLDLAAQVVPDQGRFWPLPTLGAVVHHRWVEANTRWMFGLRSGVSWQAAPVYPFHWDYLSSEFEFGVRAAPGRVPGAYIGGHVTGLVFGALGYYVEPWSGALHTGYASAQLPIPWSSGPVEGRPFRLGDAYLLPRVLASPAASPRWIASGRESWPQSRLSCGSRRSLRLWRRLASWSLDLGPPRVRSSATLHSASSSPGGQPPRCYPGRGAASPPRSWRD